MQVEMLEERWTPSMVEIVFVLPPLPRTSKSGGISVDFPILNLGWTFTLSLTPEKPIKKSIPKKRNWIPAAFSFRQNSSGICWGNTTIHAQLLITAEQDDNPVLAPQDNTGSKMTLAVAEIALTDSPSLELPLTTTCILSPVRPSKFWLIVTVSECSLPNGLFGARSGHVTDAQCQAHLVRQSGDRLLNQSLSTGKLFDVKFLAPTVRSWAPTRKLHPTYASLSVLEGHVDCSSSILGRDWLNALAAPDNIDANHAGEILCPEDHKYDELDSDFEDDEDSIPASHLVGDGYDLPIPRGQRSESSTLVRSPLITRTEKSSSSMSSFAGEEVSDLDELIKDLDKPLAGHKRTVYVMFAAHRTWRAFLWYCYTGNLEFCKLKSQVEPGNQYLRVTRLEGGPPACSPKSMYRLADLVGDKDLKAKALVAIKERMTEGNVLDETFSVFTSRYPEVQRVQLAVLTERCGSPEVKNAFLRAMKKYANMPHAEPVLSAFYDILVA